MKRLSAIEDLALNAVAVLLLIAFLSFCAHLFGGPIWLVDVAIVSAVTICGIAVARLIALAFERSGS